MIFKKRPDTEEMDEKYVKLHGKVTRMMLISFVAGILVMILGAALGFQPVSIAAAMQVFFCFGLGFFILNIGDERIDRKISAMSLPLPMMIVGGMILIGLAVFSLAYSDFITEDQYEKFKSCAGAAASFGVGLAEILPTVYYRVMLKKRCTHEVTADCERLHEETHTAGEDHSRVTTYCPVWHYFHDGVEYHSLDNDHRADKKLPTVGSSYQIKIDPQRPERLLSPYCHVTYGFKTVVGVLAIVYGFFQIKYM